MTKISFYALLFVSFLTTGCFRGVQKDLRKVLKQAGETLEKGDSAIVEVKERILTALQSMESDIQKMRKEIEELKEKTFNTLSNVDRNTEKMGNAEALKTASSLLGEQERLKKLAEKVNELKNAVNEEE